MRLLIGQPEAPPGNTVPVWQNGTPQSMQRAPCSFSVGSGRCSWNSCQSRTRVLGSRPGGSRRSYSMNPVSLPMVFLFLFSAQAGGVVGVELEGGHLGLVGESPVSRIFCCVSS